FVLMSSAKNEDFLPIGGRLPNMAGHALVVGLLLNHHHFMQARQRLAVGFSPWSSGHQPQQAGREIGFIQKVMPAEYRRELAHEGLVARPAAAEVQEHRVKIL